mgnify:CR=1 FL=1
MKKTLSLGLVVATGGVALGASAQETGETMVVVGARTPTEISQIPGAVWVVDEAQIQQQLRSGQSLKSALGRLIPGFDFGSSTNRTNYAQNFRGRDALVMINAARGRETGYADAVDCRLGAARRREDADRTAAMNRGEKLKWLG